MIFALANSFHFLPSQGSYLAGRTDQLFYFLFWMSLFFVLLIFGLMLFFSIRYRRNNPVNRSINMKGHNALEIAWTVIPLLLNMVIFGWSTVLYQKLTYIPKDALEVYVVGKQWMWKLQHVEGPRENNELHVPVGKPVRLIMISQDVIHSFFLPEFRLKRDVLPGYYESLWFQVDKPGEYNLFCAEYCGTEHSRMRGRIIALSADDYGQWLATNATNTPPAVAGGHLFQSLGCRQCHQQENGKAPDLHGIFGRESVLEPTRKVDEQAVREALIGSNVAETFKRTRIMPSYRGQLSEDQIIELLAYLKENTASSANQAASAKITGHFGASTIASAKSPRTD